MRCLLVIGILRGIEGICITLGPIPFSERAGHSLLSLECENQVMVFWQNSALVGFVFSGVCCHLSVKSDSVYEPSGRLPVPALNFGFCSMKRLGILLLTPGWDASPSQGFHPPSPGNFVSHCPSSPRARLFKSRLTLTWG